MGSPVLLPRGKAMLWLLLCGANVAIFPDSLLAVVLPLSLRPLCGRL